MLELSLKKMKQGFSAIGLFNPKFNSNVGATLRAATAFNCKMVAIEGMRYNHSSVDTSKAYRHIPVLSNIDLLKAKPTRTKLVVVEYLNTAKSLLSYTHPKSAYYVFGPEDGSVPSSILDNADDVIYIPTTICLNLACTVNIVLYDRQLKLTK